MAYAGREKMTLSGSPSQLDHPLTQCLLDPFDHQSVDLLFFLLPRFARSLPAFPPPFSLPPQFNDLFLPFCVDPSTAVFQKGREKQRFFPGGPPSPPSRDGFRAGSSRTPFRTLGSRLPSLLFALRPPLYFSVLGLFLWYRGNDFPAFLEFPPLLPLFSPPPIQSWILI